MFQLHYDITNINHCLFTPSHSSWGPVASFKNFIINKLHLYFPGWNVPAQYDLIPFLLFNIFLNIPFPRQLKTVKSRFIGTSNL